MRLLCWETPAMTKGRIEEGFKKYYRAGKNVLLGKQAYAEKRK
jgi:hypothetical protein